MPSIGKHEVLVLEHYEIIVLQLDLLEELILPYYYYIHHHHPNHSSCAVVVCIIIINSSWHLVIGHASWVIRTHGERGHSLINFTLHCISIGC